MKAPTWATIVGVIVVILGALGIFNGAQDVALDAPIIINYSEPIMAFEFGLIDGRPVSVTFNSDYTTATLQPTVPFEPGRPYEARIKSKDLAGNEMPQAYVWTFSTRQ